MQKRMKGFVFLVVIILFLSACKAATIEEALQDGNVEFVKVTHMVPRKEGAVVFFRAQADQPGLMPLAYAAVRGNERDGWEMEHSGWSHYDNENLMMSHERVFGETMVYGEMNNPFIAKVQLLDPQTGMWEDAELVREHDFFFYIFGDHQGVKAFSEDGYLISIQGTGDREMQDFHKRQRVAHDYLEQHLLLGRGIGHYDAGSIPLAEGEFLEKYKVDIPEIERAYQGEAYAYIKLSGNKVGDAYIKVEGKEKTHIFDMNLHPKMEP